MEYRRNEKVGAEIKVSGGLITKLFYRKKQ